MRTTDVVLESSRHAAPVLLNAERAERLLEQAGVDAVLATSTENVAYVSGFYSPTKLITKRTLILGLLPAGGGVPVVVGPGFEVDAWAQELPWFEDLRLYGPPPHGTGRVVGVDPNELVPDERVIYERAFAGELPRDPHEALARALEDRGLADGRIALDESGLTHRQREELVARLPRVRFSDGTELLREIRRVKTAVELDRLARVNEIANRALSDTMAAVAPGVTERELVANLNRVITEQGGMPTFACISAGRRSGYAQPLATDYRLRPGDVVKYDIGCSFGMYHADIGRTQVVGEPGGEIARVYEALHVGQQAGLAVLGPGVRPSEVFAAAVEAVRDHGLPEYDRHHVGHGIGLEVYDPPLLAPAPAGDPGADRPLEAGEVLNVETPYYVLGRYGMIVEDAVVVAQGGFRYLATGLRRVLD